MKFYVMTAPPLEITKRIFDTRIEAYFYIKNQLKKHKLPIEWTKIERSILITEINEKEIPEYVNIFHNATSPPKEINMPPEELCECEAC